MSAEFERPTHAMETDVEALDATRPVSQTFPWSAVPSTAAVLATRTRYLVCVKFRFVVDASSSQENRGESDGTESGDASPSTSGLRMSAASAGPKVALIMTKPTAFIILQRGGGGSGSGGGDGGVRGEVGLR